MMETNNDNNNNHNAEHEWVRQETARRLEALSQTIASLDSPPLTWFQQQQEQDTMQTSCETGGGDGGVSQPIPIPPQDKQQQQQSIIQNNNKDSKKEVVPSSWFFHYTGFLHKSQFCSLEECNEMKTYMQHLVDENWHPLLYNASATSHAMKDAKTDSSSNTTTTTTTKGDDNGTDETCRMESFGTDPKQNEQRGDYFLESAHRIHYFVEPAALMTTRRRTTTSNTATVDENDDPHETDKNKKNKSQVVPTNSEGKEDNNNNVVVTLQPYYTEQNKLEALNKVGHGLHLPSHYFSNNNPCNDNDNNESNKDNNKDKDNPFYRYCTSSKLYDLVVNELSIDHSNDNNNNNKNNTHLNGWCNPVIPQSMYIFKNAKCGSVVHVHQDSTFLYTIPYQTCLGIWLALDDATIENGCLWIKPKSHLLSVQKQYQRNIEYFGYNAISQRSNIPDNKNTTTTTTTVGMKNPNHQQQQQQHDETCLVGTKETMTSHNDDDNDKKKKKNTDNEGTTQPELPLKLIMKSLVENNASEALSDNTTTTTLDESSNLLPSDTTTSMDLLQLGFLPIECKAGDVLLFCGTIQHLSMKNQSLSDSNNARHTFQLHLIEGPNNNNTGGVTWSPYNWLQYPKQLSSLLSSYSTTNSQQQQKEQQQQQQVSPPPLEEDTNRNVPRRDEDSHDDNNDNNNINNNAITVIETEMTPAFLRLGPPTPVPSPLPPEK